MILAVDVGYGHTKYAFNKTLSKFPTAVASVSVTGTYGSDDSYLFNGERYLVGENAEYSDVIIPTRTEDFLVKYSPLFIYHTVKREKIENNINTIVLSLSLAEFSKKESDLKEACSNFFINGVNYKYDCLVYPQGMGIWNDIDSPDNAVIVDIGYNTIDIITFINGSPKKELSFGISDVGVCNIVDSISDYRNRKFDGMFVNQHDANEILYKGGSFSIMRKKYDISDFINEQKKIYAKRILSLLETRLKNVLNKIDKYVIAGGGAYFIPKEMVDKYSLTIPERPEYSNVAGFLKVAESSGD